MHSQEAAESKEEERKEASANPSIDSIDSIDMGKENIDNLQEVKEATLNITLPASNPLPADSKLLENAKARDPNNEEYENGRKTLEYGTSGEIIKLIDKIDEDSDPRYITELYNLFSKVRNSGVKERLLDYFTKLNDPCLLNYAGEIASNYLDYSYSLVDKAITYIGRVKCKKAAPIIRKIVDEGDDKYFRQALIALGEVGDAEDAAFIKEYISKNDLTDAQKETVMKAFAALKDKTTLPELKKIAEDSSESEGVRINAIKAIGAIKEEDTLTTLLKLFETESPNVRVACVNALKEFNTSGEANAVIVSALQDDHVKVRAEALKGVDDLKLTEAVPSLIFRADNDSEPSIKKEAIAVLSRLNSGEGNTYLIKKLEDKKVSDTIKAQIAQSLIKEGSVGESEIVKLATEISNDNRHKSLRAELGKLFIRYPRATFAPACKAYLESSDNTTVLQGLTLYKSIQDASCTEAVRQVAESKKTSAGNKRAAKKILGEEE